MVNQAVSSGYSGRHEREADILAVVYTNKAGFNPLNFGDFFNRINKKVNEIKKEQEKGLRKEYRSYQIAIIYIKIIRKELKSDGNQPGKLGKKNM